MSVLEEQISRLKQIIGDCYIAISENNGKVPEDQTLINLPEAIKTATSGGSSKAVEELLCLPDSLPEGVIFLSDTEVYKDLEDIMCSMDLELSVTQAKAITAQVSNRVGNDTSTNETHINDKGSNIEVFYGVVPPKDCEWMQEQEVYDHLQQLMQAIDPDLTAEMSQSITQATQNS